MWAPGVRTLVLLALLTAALGVFTFSEYAEARARQHAAEIRTRMVLAEEQAAALRVQLRKLRAAYAQMRAELEELRSR